MNYQLTKKIKNYNIIGYEISSIHLTLSVSANLEEKFHSDNDKLHSRKYLWESQEYLDWWLFRFFYNK